MCNYRGEEGLYRCVGVGGWEDQGGEGVCVFGSVFVGGRGEMSLCVILRRIVLDCDYVRMDGYPKKNETQENSYKDNIRRALG